MYLLTISHIKELIFNIKNNYNHAPSQKVKVYLFFLIFRLIHVILITHASLQCHNLI